MANREKEKTVVESDIESDVDVEVGFRPEMIGAEAVYVGTECCGGSFNIPSGSFEIYVGGF